MPSIVVAHTPRYQRTIRHNLTSLQFVANMPLGMRPAFEEFIEQTLRSQGESPINAVRRAGLKRDAIRSIFRGRSPSIERAHEICTALGVEFRIGAAERPALPSDTEGHRWGNRRGEVVTPVEVPIREGHASPMVGYSPNGCASYGLDFLLNFGLDPALCEVIEIFDDSMAPEFPAGLVDLRRTERVDGWVYTLGVPELTVRRAKKTLAGWMATADHPEYGAMAWADDFLIVGKVVWTSHMVHTEPMEMVARA